MQNTAGRAAGVLAVAAMLGSSATLAAQKPDKQKPHQVRQTDAEPPAPASADAIAAEALLEEMTSQVSDDLVAIAHPDGTISMDLQGRFMSVMVVKTNKDGSQTTACETGHDAFVDALAKHAPTAPVSKPQTKTTETPTPAREIR
jgi:hypothetical protein